MKKLILKHQCELFLFVASIMICIIGHWSKSSVTFLLSALLTPLFNSIVKNLYIQLFAIAIMFCVSPAHSLEVTLIVILTCFFAGVIHYNSLPINKDNS